MKRNLHKGILRDEDDDRMLNTRIAQRKHAIPHSMMKLHRKLWSVLVTALGNQPKAFALDLGADQSTLLVMITMMILLC